MGTLAEVYVGLELISNNKPYQAGQLFYWLREAKSSNAEVDYVIQSGQSIIPIEVKASGKEAMHSLHIFLKEKACPLGVRISTENFGRYDKVLTLPLYAVAELGRVLGSV